EHVDDSGAELDALGRAGQLGEHREGVPAVCLGDPDAVVTEAVGLLDVGDDHVAGYVVGIGNVDPDLHAVSLDGRPGAFGRAGWVPHAEVKRGAEVGGLSSRVGPALPGRVSLAN